MCCFLPCLVVVLLVLYLAPPKRAGAPDRSRSDRIGWGLFFGLFMLCLVIDFSVPSDFGGSPDSLQVEARRIRRTIAIVMVAATIAIGGPLSAFFLGRRRKKPPSKPVDMKDFA
jgi:hypothetical protein